MKGFLVSLMVVAFAAGGVLVVGCGEEETKTKKPPRSKKRARRSSGSSGKPRQSPPGDEGMVPPGPEGEWMAGMDEPPGPRRGRRKPRGREAPGPWATAKVGTMVRMEHSNGSTTVLTVVKADEKTVTCRITTGVPGAKPIVHTMVQPRFMDENEIKNRYDEAGQRSGTRTITIGDERLRCRGYQVRSSRNDRTGRTATKRMYFSKEVPGWLVLHETDSSGKKVALSKVVEYVR